MRPVVKSPVRVTIVNSVNQTSSPIFLAFSDRAIVNEETNSTVNKKGNGLIYFQSEDSSAIPVGFLICLLVLIVH